MRYDDSWQRHPPRQRVRREPFRGFRSGYDAPYRERPRGPDRARFGGRGYDSGYREEGWYGGGGRDLPADYPPRHWGGVDPRQRLDQRGYPLRGSGPGRGPGGFFRGGF